jgi:hypothetical protein
MIKLKELLNEKKSQQYKEHRNEFIEMVNNFGSLGQSIYKSGKDLKEISETINRVCGLAEVFTLNETEDWFDEVTVKRNIGSLKEAKGTFIESAKEMSKLQQRLEGAYEDIGQVLGRYYEIKEATDDYDGTNVDGYVKDNPHDDEDTNGNVPN